MARATPSQLNYIAQLSGAFPQKRLTKRQASQMIERLKEERFQALCRAYERADADLQRSGDILSIAEGVTTLKKQGGAWHCGPCPQCGGHDRFYINTLDNLFKCGHAAGGNGCGWGGGIAQLAAYAWNCSTWDAIDTLSGQSLRDDRPVRSRQVSREVIKPSEARRNEQDDTTKNKHQQIFVKTIRQMEGPVGSEVREYLLRRGIKQQTWELNQVGAGFLYDRRAVVCFPHFLSGELVGINRRIVGAFGNGKTRFVKGGHWGLFMLKPIAGAQTLIVVEGEINGLSIWQAVRAKGLLVDVISVGSEGAFKKLAQPLSERAQNYSTLLVWADKLKIAQQAQCHIQHDYILPIQSPRELDANNLLKAGILETFLTRLLVALDKVNISSPTPARSQPQLTESLAPNATLKPVLLPKAELDEEELIVQAAMLAERCYSEEREKFYLSVEDAVIDRNLAQAYLNLQKFRHFVEEEERLSAWAALNRQSIPHSQSQNALYL